jgi:exopolysaccharide biosynthesis polyprenyl glycosylphosphotransferase
MLKEKNLFMQRALIALDVLIVSSAFIMSFYLREHFNLVYRLNFLPSIQVFEKVVKLNVNDYLAAYFFLVLFWSAAFYMNGMYRQIHTKSLIEVSWILIKSFLWVTIAFSVVVFFFKFQFVSRLFFAFFMGLAAVTVFFEKAVVFAFMRRFLRKEENQKNLLVVGTGKRAVHLIQTIKTHPEWGYRVAKVVDYAQCLLFYEPIGDDGRKIHHCEVIETEYDMRRILHSQPIDEVIFVVPRNRLDFVERYLHVCESEGVDAAIAADFFNIKVSKLHHTDLDGIPLITLEKTFDKEWQLFLKRIVDIVVSGAGILVLSPLLLLVVILIRLTSKGPAVFAQKRVSVHGRIFTLYKFRSMNMGAEGDADKLAPLNEMKGPVFKIKNDPRITPMGKLLRRFSIDELPQLFNVFMGTMSLVGPRPGLPKEVEKYEPWQRRRLSMRPGIACLWQVYHRDENDFEKWMQSDLNYVDNWSLASDFKIIIKTILGVIVGRGAY